MAGLQASPVWLGLAAANGALGVGFGALGAHGGNPLAGFIATGSQFQLLHAVVLLVLAFALPGTAGRARLFLRAACLLFLAGILLFSGALYLRALSGAPGASALAPFGGAGLILGWLALMLGALLSRRG